MKTIACIASATLLLCTLASGQTPPKNPPASPPSAPPAGAPIQPSLDPATGRPPNLPSAEEMVELIMKSDKNGDGKLSRDEMPRELLEEFAVMDANHDGFVDRAELMAFAKHQEEEYAKMRNNRASPRVRGAGGAQSFEGAMKQSNRGFKGLQDSEFNAESRTQDLENIQAVQLGLVAAKGLCSMVQMSPAAKAKYGDDKAKYLSAMRGELIETLQVAIALEQAVLAGDSKQAKSLFQKLDHEMDEGHEQFKTEEENRRGGPPTSPDGGQPKSPAPGGKKP